MTADEVRQALTGREVALLRALSEGMRYQDAAAKLHLSLHTVTRRMETIKAKLHANTAIAAMAVVVRAGVV